MNTNNPFDWKNYKPTISFADLEKARKNAYQAARYINEQRKQGIEPSAPYTERTDISFGDKPKEMVIDMPVMPMHKRSLNKKARKQ